MIFLLLFLTSANAAIKDIQIDLCSYGLCDTGSSIVQPASGNTANPMSADYSPSGHYAQGYAGQVFTALSQGDPKYDALTAQSKNLEHRRDETTRLVREATYPDYTKIKHEQYVEHAEFQVTWSELTPIRNGLLDSKPTKPKQMFAKDYGLLAVLEADRSYIAGHVHDAHEYKVIATEFLNLTLGLDPVSGFARSSYELITGRNFVTGSHLNRFERGIAFVGVVSLGGESTVAKLVGVAGKLGHRLINVSSIKASITYGREIIETRLGKVVSHVRQWGRIELEEGLKEFDTASYLGNTVSLDTVYVRVVPRSAADGILSGLKRLSTEQEAFITLDREIVDMHRLEVSHKLSLYEKDGSLRTLEDHVKVKFKLTREIETLSIDPIQYPHYIAGGRTKGGSMEFIIPSDSVERGLIDQASMTIEEIL